MKSMKKEYIVLGVIIVLLLAYLAMKKTNKVFYDIPKLDTLKAEAFDKIDIIKKDQTLSLAKVEDKWVIAPKNYPVDEGKSKSIIDVVTSLTLTDLVSKAKNYSRYHLDEENGIHVKVFLKDKEVRDFYIGKAAPTYGHTFVKIKDNDNVYLARESFRTNFDVKPNDIRNKNVMKLDQNEISEIDINKEGQNLQFVRNVKSAVTPELTKDKEEKADPEPVAPPQKPEDEISWLLPDGKKAQRSVIDSLLTNVADLSCERYLEDKTKEDFKAETPIYTITFKGTKDFQINIYKKLP